MLLVLPAMVVWSAYQNMWLHSMAEPQWAEFDVAIEGIQQRYEQVQGSS